MSTPLPPDLPAPVDDGAAAHLPGRAMPAVTLTSTTGEPVRLDRLGPGRTVIYCYPLTGRADVDLPAGWDAIPGARGCTNEACDFRDHHTELLAAGAVAGTACRPDHGLPGRARRPVAAAVPDPRADPEQRLARELKLPTFAADGMTLYRRHTLVVTDGVIERVFYPVFPPNQHASEVLAWLAVNR